MSVLAINLAPQLIRDFESKPSIRTACDIEQALNLLQTEDFQIVIEDVRLLPSAQADLASLLAATHPGTTIYAVVSSLWLPDSEYWASQGIQLIFGDPVNYLSKQLQPS